MHLDPTAFNALLNDLGQTVDWRPAFACPCRNPRSGGAASACPQCHGLGTYWGAPTRCRVALSGQQVQREWAQFGQWESGDQVVSIPSDSAAYAMGPADRLTMCDSSVPFSVVLRDATEPLRGSVLSLERVAWWDQQRLVTASPTPLCGLDGRLAWVGDTTPPAGTPVAVDGRKHPEYFVFQTDPQDRAHHGGASLPRRVVLRVFDIFGRSQ